MVDPRRAWLDQLAAAPLTSTHAVTKAKAGDIAGLDEAIRSGGKRKIPKHGNFTAFLTGGMASDEWPFMLVGESRRPMNFIAALLADTDPNDADAESLWLTLEDFALRVADAARYEQAKEERASLDEALPPATTPPRTWRPL